MLTLSVRQPWATLIALGYKDIENRVWSTKVREAVWIHASLTNDRKTFELALRMARDAGVPQVVLETLTPDLPRGGIVGLVEIADCLERSTSPWYIEGNHAFVLRNAQSVPYMRLKGQLKLFKGPDRQLLIPQPEIAATSLLAA